MHERRLGRTGLSVSEIGYGAWGIGGEMWLGAEDEESLRALNRAIDLGVNFIDTALVYGRGHSEQLVGEVVRERDERIVVASKIPPKNLAVAGAGRIDPDEAFPADHVRKCTERTLSNLGLDVLDVQQFHVWSDEWVGRGSWLEGIQALKDEGKIRFFGVSINDLQPSNAVRLIETGVVDTVQVIYNVFEQAPEDELLAACERNDVGVIARVPFDEGALTGRIAPGLDVPRGRLPQRVLQRRAARAGRRARARDPRRPRDLARGAAGGGAALRAQPARGLDGDPRHADRAQRRAQLRGRRRRGPARGARLGLEGAPLGAGTSKRLSTGPCRARPKRRSASMSRRRPARAARPRAAREGLARLRLCAGPGEPVARRQHRAEQQRLAELGPVHRLGGDAELLERVSASALWASSGGRGCAITCRMSASSGSATSPLQTPTIQRAWSSSSGKYGPCARN